MDLGDRMKYYESRGNSEVLMPMIPGIARVDGRSFHTWCRGLNRPFDERFQTLMQSTAAFLVQETGALCAYVQSDEISLVWYAEEFSSEIFFRGRVFKMNSVIASLAAASFNHRVRELLPERDGQLAAFDCRVWQVPTLDEVVNYFVWRERDAVKNSITMAAQAHYTESELHEKTSSDKQEMLHKKGVNWNNYPDHCRRGSYFARRKTRRPFSADEIDRLPPKHAARKDPNLVVERSEIVRLDMPPIARVSNRLGVLVCGEDPEEIGARASD